MSRDRINSPRNQLRRQKELKAACPSGKKRYRTEEQAQTALDRIQHADNTARVKIPARAYLCPYCAGWHVTSQRVPLVSRTPIPQRSAKLAAIHRTMYKPFVVKVLEERPWCEVKFDENCTGRATGLHHLRKRSQGGGLTDPANVLASCSYCNGAIEDNPIEAHERGFVIRREDVAS